MNSNRTRKKLISLIGRDAGSFGAADKRLRSQSEFATRACRKNGHVIFSLADHLQHDPDLLIECLKTPGVFTRINKRHDFIGDLYRLFNRPESVKEICLGSLLMVKRRREGLDWPFWSEKKLRKHADFHLFLCHDSSEIHHSLTFWQAVVKIEPELISYALCKNREWRNDNPILQQLKHATVSKTALATSHDCSMFANQFAEYLG